MHLPSLDGVRSPRATTFLLGVGADLPLANADVELERSDGVLVYTDGATDVRQGETRLGSDGLSRLLAPLVRAAGAGRWSRRRTRRCSAGPTNRSATTSASSYSGQGPSAA